MSDRGNYDSHCQEIAERVLPMHSTLFTSRGYQTKGEKRNQELFDSTASISLNRFAAIMGALLCPQSDTWHRMRASDESLNRNRNVRIYFEEVNKILFQQRYMPRANFTAQIYQHFKSLGAYGTGATFIDELYGEYGIRYRNIHLSEIYFAENHQGLIDTAYRCFQMTARQAVQKWGDGVSEKVREAATKNPEQTFEFVHCVKPRKNPDIERRDFKGMVFAAYYIEREGKRLLDEQGYNTFPYPASRYEQAAGEVYGRSPAMDVLPAIKTLNEQKKTMLKQGHRAVDPVLLGADDGVLDGFNLTPGAFNPGGVSKDGQPLVHTLPVGRLDIGKDLMDDERSDIKDAFLVNLFQILVDNPARTATEVLEIAREKGVLLSPIGRQNSEFLGPVNERELDILSMQRQLPKMPPELLEAAGQYAIIYENPIAKSQRSNESAGLFRTLELVVNTVNITKDPAPLDHFNWDTIIPEVSENQNVPARWMNSIETIKGIRAGRTEQNETQTAIQAGPSAAAMLKAVGTVQKGARG